MPYSTLTQDINNQIATLIINRPQQLNALNRATIEELNTAFKDLESNPDVRVIILTGSGEKAFVAGADIKEFADFNVQEGTELAARGHDMLFDLVENLNKPVIAAVNGFALGGGLELAMACHVRIASTNARMGLPETGLGVIPGYGGTQRLANLVGKGRAMEMICTAEMIKADRAYETGLVNQLVEPEELMESCQAMAVKMIKNSPQAIHSAIRSVNAGFKFGMNGFKVEIEEFGKCFGTEDFKEGTRAFLEKRKANFKA
ncbi:MAG: enoyl-CoA hydratase-related protein [Owenweeksia sp.]